MFALDAIEVAAMRRALAVSAFTLVMMAACTANDSTAPSSNGPADVASAKSCDAVEHDLSKEPNYPVDYIHRWTTAEGCDVRLDVLMTRQGKNACVDGERVGRVLGYHVP